jgi:hypothetical protein
VFALVVIGSLITIIPLIALSLVLQRCWAAACCSAASRTDREAGAAGRR